MYFRTPADRKTKGLWQLSKKSDPTDLKHSFKSTLFGKCGGDNRQVSIHMPVPTGGVRDVPGLCCSRGMHEAVAETAIT